MLGPNASPNPIVQNTVLEIRRSSMFLTATLVLFLVRTSPASRQRKPVCMIKTSATHSVIQTMTMDSLVGVLIQNPISTPINKLRHNIKLA